MHWLGKSSGSQVNDAYAVGVRMTVTSSSVISTLHTTAEMFQERIKQFLNFWWARWSLIIKSDIGEWKGETEFKEIMSN